MRLYSIYEHGADLTRDERVMNEGFVKQLQVKSPDLSEVAKMARGDDFNPYTADYQLTRYRLFLYNQAVHPAHPAWNRLYQLECEFRRAVDAVEHAEDQKPAVYDESWAAPN